MRKVVAMLLLICVGIMIPASASPARICFLEFGLKSCQAESKCCPDCNRDSGLPDPCCMDLEELPDAPAPQLPVELPAAAGADVPASFCAARRVLTEHYWERSFVSKPIRGPTSPAAYRAVLGIWRL